MSWIELNEDEHLLAVMNSERLEGIRAAALKLGQADPVQPSFDMVTGMVRGFVNVPPGNILGAGDTIPESLLLPALDLCIYYIAKRVGQQTEDDSDAKDDAMKTLDKVALGKFDIGEPAIADDSDAQASSELVKQTTPRFSRETLDGL